MDVGVLVYLTAASSLGGGGKEGRNSYRSWWYLFYSKSPFHRTVPRVSLEVL